MKCIDLRKEFGAKFRVKREAGHSNQTRDPWLWQLTGAQGQICPYGGDELMLCLNWHPKISGRLKKESWLRCVQDGDDGCNFVFNVKDIAKAIKESKAYQKRTCNFSIEERIKIGERLKAGRNNS